MSSAIHTPKYGKQYKDCVINEYDNAPIKADSILSKIMESSRHDVGGTSGRGTVVSIESSYSRTVDFSLLTTCLSTLVKHSTLMGQNTEIIMGW